MKGERRKREDPRKERKRECQVGGRNDPSLSPILLRQETLNLSLPFPLLTFVYFHSSSLSLSLSFPLSFSCPKNQLCPLSVGNHSWSCHSQKTKGLRRREFEWKEEETERNEIRMEERRETRERENSDTQNETIYCSVFQLHNNIENERGGGKEKKKKERG